MASPYTIPSSSPTHVSDLIFAPIQFILLISTLKNNKRVPSFSMWDDTFY